MTLRTRLLIGFSVPVVLLVATGILAMRSQARGRAYGAAVERTLQAELLLQRVQGETVRMIASARARVLSGSTAFDDAVRASARAARAAVDSLDRLVADDPRQRERHALLERAVEERIAAVEATLAPGAIMTPDEARGRIAGGEAALRSLLALAREMEAEAQGALAVRREAMDTWGRRTTLFLGATGLLALVATGIGLGFVLAELRERDWARQALARSEARYRAAIDAGFDGLLQVEPVRDARGAVADFQVSDLNVKGADLAGLTREALLSRPLGRLLEDGRLQGLLDALQQAMASGRALEREFADTAPDGAIRRLQALVVPFGPGLLVTVRDVTDRWLAQGALQRYAAELKRSNEELERFAYVASHDLQEPLRTVTGYAQLLARQQAGRLDPESATFLGFVADGAERMRALIQALLEYSRVGREPAPLGPVPLADALRAAEAALAAALEESGATLRVAGALPVVRGHGPRLAQVFQNLLGNAIRYRGAAPPRIVIAAARRGALWEVSVADNGIGVDARHATRIFEPFQRLHTRQEHEGTGIGLSICQRIVEQAGGRIWHEPNPDGGSIFRFTLPDAATAPAAA